MPTATTIVKSTSGPVECESAFYGSAFYDEAQYKSNVSATLNDGWLGVHYLLSESVEAVAAALFAAGFLPSPAAPWGAGGVRRQATAAVKAESVGVSSGVLVCCSCCCLISVRASSACEALCCSA